MRQYKNSFYDGTDAYGPEFYETDAEPVEHLGCLIYERIKGVCFDIVCNGICVHQRSSLNAAKTFINRIAVQLVELHSSDYSLIESITGESRRADV